MTVKTKELRDAPDLQDALAGDEDAAMAIVPGLAGEMAPRLAGHQLQRWGV